ncbi:hypothetical protein CCR75_003799 [Bremia lactucae]|uniref:Uncharacterized protein n=1 Tax=Bremia lactucae TaxID=4779 RepID=A0A976FJN4_BRELC|nr:hypothetical protein CCR75_003799 [Bremia lactucae]
MNACKTTVDMNLVLNHLIDEMDTALMSFVNCLGAIIMVSVVCFHYLTAKPTDADLNLLQRIWQQKSFEALTISKRFLPSQERLYYHVASIIHKRHEYFFAN